MMTLNGQITARAFHTATRLPNGQVLIAGGEAAVGNPAQITTVAGGIRFDSTVGSGTWGAFALRRPRSRHSATLDANGRVLLFGGIKWDKGQASMVDVFEWYDPDEDLMKSQPVQGAYTRVGHSGIALLGDKYVVLTGGATASDKDGSLIDPPRLALDDAVRFFRYSPEEKVMATKKEWLFTLETPRLWAATARLGTAADKLVMMGGFGGIDPVNPHDLFAATSPLSTTEVVRLSPEVGRLSDPPPIGSPARGHSCAVTLKDGRVLLLGGRSSTDGGSSYRPTNGVNLVYEVSRGGTTGVEAEELTLGRLLQGRYLTSCTLLDDGSVLVAGGILEEGGAFGTLDSLEIFMPRPVD